MQLFAELRPKLNVLGLHNRHITGFGKLTSSLKVTFFLAKLQATDCDLCFENHIRFLITPMGQYGSRRTRLCIRPTCHHQSHRSCPAKPGVACCRVRARPASRSFGLPWVRDFVQRQPHGICLLQDLQAAAVPRGLAVDIPAAATLQNGTHGATVLSNRVTRLGGAAGVMGRAGWVLAPHAGCTLCKLTICYLQPSEPLFLDYCFQICTEITWSNCLLVKILRVHLASLL